MYMRDILSVRESVEGCFAKSRPFIFLNIGGSGEGGEN